MKCKDKKGPRYFATSEDSGVLDEWTGRHIDDHGVIARTLNAGERARQQVKRLKAEVAHLRNVAGVYCPCKVCKR